MPLALNEEQRLLQDTAREFLEGKAPVEALRKLRDDRDPMGWSPALWQDMAELGWAGIALPENYGGLEFGYVGLGAVIEETGRRLTASPLLSTVVLGASLIEAAGDENQKTTLLPQIAAGELTLALALDEGSRHAPLNIATTAVETDGGWLLNGEKAFVPDASGARRLIVVARISGHPGDTNGLGCFVVDPETSGISRQRHIMADSRDMTAVKLENASVASDALLGGNKDVWALLEPVLDRGRICLAAEMLGSATEAFERTVAYMKERKQFDAVIGSFQALKHRASIMYIELELSRSVVLDALSAIDEQRPDLAQCASHAKAMMNDTYHLVSSEAVQLHGGIGVTDELEIGFFLKRSRMASQLLGDSGFHRDRWGVLNGI